MKAKKNPYTLAIVISILIMLPIIPTTIAESSADTVLEITSIRGGFAKVIIDVKNIGTEIAEEIQMAIEVKGGILGKIDLLHICAGCSSCGTTLDPDAIKTESTSETGMVFGLGPLTIIASASALNAPEITANATGLVIGPFVIIQ